MFQSLPSFWKAQQLGLQPLVYVRGFASAGVDPKIMGISVLFGENGAEKTYVLCEFERKGFGTEGWNILGLPPTQ